MPPSGIPLKKKGKGVVERKTLQSLASCRMLPHRTVCTSACRKLARVRDLAVAFNSRNFLFRRFLGTSRDTRVRPRATRQLDREKLDDAPMPAAPPLVRSPALRARQPIVAGLRERRLIDVSKIYRRSFFFMRLYDVLRTHRCCLGRKS